MANPTTRQEFKDYCLRSLGDGVIQINVSDDQVEDRIDQALYYYQQFHMDAVIRTLLKHEITPSTMRLNAPATGFLINEEIFGNTSLAHGVVDTAFDANSNVMTFYTTHGTFQAGEIIRGLNSGSMATVNAAANAVTLGDFDNKYIPIGSPVVSIVKIFAPYDSRMSAEILFDPQSQFNISLLSNFTSNSIIPYVIGRQYQQLLNDTFRGRPGTRFARHEGRLHIDVSWQTTFLPHSFMIADCMVALDGDNFPLIWSDNWLEGYAEALIKKQWANNLKKYTGIALPGGVKLDGKTMFDEAVLEIKALEDTLQSTFQLPIDFMVG